MEKDTEYKVKSIRADDEAYEKFKTIAQEEFGNQGQCFSTLINLYEIEKGKVQLSERKLEIDSFQMHLNKMSELFLMSLGMNQEAEERVRGEFDKLLDSKDKMIQNLQERADKDKVKIEGLKKQVEEEKKNASESFNKYYDIQEKYNKDKDTYEKGIADKDNLNKVLADTCNDQKERIGILEGKLEDNKADIEDYIKLKDKYLKMELESKEIKAQLEKSKIEYEAEFNNLRSTYELDKEKALIQLEKEQNRELKELNSQHNQEIKSYIEKIEELQNKLNQEKIDTPTVKKTTTKKTK